MTDTTNEDLFNLLDKELDDIADLPSFAVPYTGMYRLKIGMEVKPINNKPAAVAKFEVRELIELAEPDKVPENERAKTGDKFDIPHILKDEQGKDSEIAWGRLKELCTPFAEVAGSKNTKAIVKHLADNPVDITARIKRVLRKKKSPGDDDVYDARIDMITVD